MLNKAILRTQCISRRSFLIGGGKLGLLSLLGVRMFYMQVLNSDEYKTLSDKNRISFILVPPFRGHIYDIGGNVIATNKACFRLLLDRNIGDNYEEELKQVGHLLALSEEKQTYINNKVRKASRRTPVVILDYLSWEQISLIEEQKQYFSSIFIDVGYSRFYPASDSTCHILGYIGQISEQERQELEVTNLNDFYVGKCGIEKYYEEKLRGEFGYRQVEINAYGKQVREIENVASKQGEDIHLNIDSRLQQKIQPYLNKQGCSAIVMDITNGNVLLLAASPVFEPNNFNKLSQEYWQSLINDPYKPLINKTIQNTYPPGSAFKLITVLAALEAGVSPDKAVYCTGMSALGGNNFRCSNHATPRWINNMYEAIKHSCNSYMFELARMIGSKKILEMARRFGLGYKTDIDLMGEAFGFVPSHEWKYNKLKSKWSIGDTLNLSIGQGFLLTTPIQLTRFVAAIANNGKLYTPRIAKNEPAYKQIDIAQQHLNIVKEGMYMTVNAEGGTAYYSRIIGENRELAGKTGTSQVQSKAHAKDDLSRDSIAWERRNHGIFIGFAPYNKPRYAINVFVDHGGGGGRAAAPIASKIMTAVLEKYL